MWVEDLRGRRIFLRCRGFRIIFEFSCGIGGMRRRVKDVKLRQVAIEHFWIWAKSRDDIPVILLGLQAIYVEASTPEYLFAFARTATRADGSGGVASDGPSGRYAAVEHRGAGVVKAGRDCDWDRLEWMANDAKFHAPLSSLPARNASPGLPAIARKLGFLSGISYIASRFLSKKRAKSPIVEMIPLGAKLDPRFRDRE